MTMMLIGALCVVVAVVLIVLGALSVVAQWLLYLGIALLVVGALFVVVQWVAGRRSTRL